MTNTKINDGGPAYPRLPYTNKFGVEMDDGSFGMSLRDAAALAALPSIIRACVPMECLRGETMEQMFARKAFLIADAFIAARETKET